MYYRCVLAFLAFVALIGVCVHSTEIKVNGGDGPCCPKNSSLKCCCERLIPYYQVGSLKVNWWTANLLCKQSGMDLATILTQEEENALSQYLVTLKLPAGYDNGVWIGGTDEGLPSYYWTKTGQPILYSAFMPGQPDGVGGEDCLEWLTYAPQQYGWNDYNCKVNLLYVCQSRRNCI